MKTSSSAANAPTLIAALPLIRICSYFGGVDGASSPKWKLFFSISNFPSDRASILEEIISASFGRPLVNL